MDPLGTTSREDRLGGKNFNTILRHSVFTLNSHGWRVSAMFSRGLGLSRVPANCEGFNHRNLISQKLEPVFLVRLHVAR